MSVTQDYKKRHACCNFDCHQGRNCPMDRAGDSAFVGLLLVIASAALMVTPLLYYVWG